jgi:hypothetical protein
MSLKAVGWLTGICLFMLTGRAIYVYLEWFWRTRQIRQNDQWLAHLERERKAIEADDDRAA